MPYLRLDDVRCESPSAPDKVSKSARSNLHCHGLCSRMEYLPQVRSKVRGLCGILSKELNSSRTESHSCVGPASPEIMVSRELMQAGQRH